MRDDRRILKDNIQSITKSSIRKLARRGGVKRISGAIYEDVRAGLKIRLEEILKAVVEILGRLLSFSKRSTRKLDLFH